MRNGMLLAIALMCLLLPARKADAAWRFGADETVHFIQDVKLKGQNKEELFLGYMTKIQLFIAGVYISDEGYVLGVKGDSKKYYQMPTAAELARFQKGGFLPDPLPPYALSFWDYLFGYSLWWVIGGAIAWVMISSRRKKRRTTALAAQTVASAAAPTPPATPPAA